MRIVVQRVSSASVVVDDDVVGEIGRGLLLLVGAEDSDTEDDAATAVDKIANLRIFGDEAGKMNRSVLDTGGSVLVVSQFTLLADIRKGRRPSFVGAGSPEHAEHLLGELASGFASLGLPTETGRFGARMKVDLVNDGPVTIVVEVKDRKIR